MTEPTKIPKSDNAKFWVDLGPVIVFVISYQVLQRRVDEGAIYTAGLIFMVAAILGLIYSRLKLGKFSGLLVFTTVVIAVTVGLSYAFQDPRFLYYKPTVMNIAYGILAIGGVVLGKNLIKLLLGDALNLPRKAWDSLAIRWGVFFFVLAGINEFVWRNFSEEFWVNFKLLGFLPITLLFTFAQIPFILKHQIMDEKTAENASE